MHAFIHIVLQKINLFLFFLFFFQLNLRCYFFLLKYHAFLLIYHENFQYIPTNIWQKETATNRKSMKISFYSVYNTSFIKNGYLKRIEIKTIKLF